MGTSSADTKLNIGRCHQYFDHTMAYNMTHRSMEANYPAFLSSALGTMLRAGARVSANSAALQDAQIDRNEGLISGLPHNSTRTKPHLLIMPFSTHRGPAR